MKSLLIIALALASIPPAYAQKEIPKAYNAKMWIHKKTEVTNQALTRGHYPVIAPHDNQTALTSITPTRLQYVFATE